MKDLRKALIVGTALAALGLGLPFSASAGPIPGSLIAPTDFADIDPGDLLISTLFNYDNFEFATLTSQVWFNEDTGIYTYVYAHSAGVLFVSEINLGQAFLAFTGVAGWNFDGLPIPDVVENGFTPIKPCTNNDPLSPGYDCDLFVGYDPDETIDWFHNPPFTLDTGEDIALFAQSTQPWRIGTCNGINGIVATANCYTPVPEPGALLLLGAGLIGLVATRRRKTV